MYFDQIAESTPEHGVRENPWSGEHLQDEARDAVQQMARMAKTFLFPYGATYLQNASKPHPIQSRMEFRCIYVNVNIQTWKNMAEIKLLTFKI